MKKVAGARGGVEKRAPWRLVCRAGAESDTPLAQDDVIGVSQRVSVTPTVTPERS